MGAPELFGEDKLALAGAAQAVGFVAVGDQNFVAPAEQCGAFEARGIPRQGRLAFGTGCWQGRRSLHFCGAQRIVLRMILIDKDRFVNREMCVCATSDPPETRQEAETLATV